MQLQLTNVIDISVQQVGVGAGQYNTSNLALFTSEVPDNSFGTDGYKIYLSPTEVATDFGSDSETYAMAVQVFSQQPNILANNGYLVVIPLIVSTQHLAFSTVPTAGHYVINHGADATAFIPFGDTAAQVQTALRLLPNLGSVIVTGDTTAGFDVQFSGVYGTQALLTITSDTLTDVTTAPVTITVTSTVAAENLNAAIVRTEDLVQYFGVMGNSIFPQVDMLAAAATIQTLNKIAFFVSKTAADVAPGGMLDLLRSGGLSQSRGLFYGGLTVASALGMMASYAGRALSVNFSGSNTTQTMHLKDLAGVQPDPSMTQNILNQCMIAGVDTYISLQGIAKVFTSGANKFFDQVYNLQWLVGALQIAGFNALAQTGTKIPQTEQGVSSLKAAYRQVAEQAVTNQYSAPGQWTSPTTFGNLSDFFANVSQRGYYIYSLPVAQQLPSDRALRKAPLIQIALKEAGAIHSSNVIVNVNA